MSSYSVKISKPIHACISCILYPLHSLLLYITLQMLENEDIEKVIKEIEKEKEEEAEKKKQKKIPQL